MKKNKARNVLELLVKPKKSGRKPKRACISCNANGSIFPICNACRVEGCQHIIRHYDSALNTVCDDCGTVLKRVKNFPKITSADLQTIRTMLADKKSVVAINRSTAVSFQLIERIKAGDYKHEYVGLKRYKESAP